MSAPKRTSGFAPIAVLLIVLVAITGLMTLAQHEDLFKTRYNRDVKGALAIRTEVEIPNTKDEATPGSTPRARLESEEDSVEGLTEEEVELKRGLESELDKVQTAEIEVKQLGERLAVKIRSNNGQMRTTELPAGLSFTFGRSSESATDIRSDGAKVYLTTNDVEVETALVFRLNKTRELMVTAADGSNIDVLVTPEKAVAKVRTGNDGQVVQSLELVSQPNPNFSDKVAYKVKTVEILKLFSLFPLTIVSTTQIGASSGEILSTDRPFWVEILSAFLGPR